MYIKLDEYDSEMVKRVMEKINCKREYIVHDDDMLITPDNLLDIFYELKSAYDNLKEEYDDFKQDVRDNYKQINVADQYEVSDHDFI